MGEIFHIYASHGQNNYVELDLPASDYELLDMMERLRLAPGQAPYAEVLKIREQYDYLDKCIHDQPDVYQLNALARKLSEFTSTQEMAAFEGLVGMEIGKKAVTIGLSGLIHAAEYLGGLLADGCRNQPDFMQKLSTVLEFENCHRLDDVARIARDLDSYDVISREHFLDQVTQELSGQAWAKGGDAVKGCFDYAAYAAALAERQGYQTTADGLNYIRKQDSPVLEHQQGGTISRSTTTSTSSWRISSAASGTSRICSSPPCDM